MRDNPLQFAVVREDPLVERAVLERYGCRKLLLVASGGCTALALRHPQRHLTLVDPNPAQLAWVRHKDEALQTLTGAALLRAFNVGDPDATGLSEAGNFESLFRGLRSFLHEHVATDAQIGEVLAGTRDPAWLLAAPYWPVAFSLYFSDALLRAMFGPAAVQHAPVGSYPGYFQRCFERGLERPDRSSNPFLHHLLRGCYAPDALPELLRASVAGPWTLLEGTLEAQDFAAYDFIGLSNVMDWMAPSAVGALLAQLASHCRPGTVVCWRQLNNDRPLQAALQGRFDFDDALAVGLHEQDRSLFYSSLHIGLCRGRDPSTG